MATITEVLPRPTTATAGLWSWDNNRRPQADRCAVRRDRTGLHAALRHRGRAHTHAAGHAGLGHPRAGPLQPDVHHARHGDDLHGHHADERGLLQFRGAPGDRCPGRCIPSPERTVLLDIPVRRDPDALQLHRRPGAGRRVVLVRQPDRATFQQGMPAWISGPSGC